MKKLHATWVLVLLICWIRSSGAETRRDTGGVVKNDVECPSQNSTALKVPPGKWSWLWWKQTQPNPDKQLVKVASADQAQDKRRWRRRKRRRPKTGKQKMADCRHLAATLPGAGSRVKRWWRKVARPHNTAGSIGAASTSWADRNVAYGMAVAATLSYWDFHKKPLADNRTFWEVLTLKEGSPKPLSRYRKPVRRVLSNMRLALDEAQPWFNLLTNRTKKSPPQDVNTTSRWNSLWEQRFRSYRDKLEAQAADYQAKWRQLRNRYATRRKHQIQLEYSFYNWYEPTALGYYHDTDLLIATCNGGNTLIVAFAGTASVPDTVTNLQTFEPAQHSGFFHNKTLEGSIHRGFLNAYSRVERGSVLRLCDHANCTTPLYSRYGHCTAQDTTPNSNHSTVDADANRKTQKPIDINATAETAEESIVRKKGRRGCKVKNKKLMTILRKLVTDYLSTGKSVLLSGHSLGGSLATLHALDIIINFPHVPIQNLELWTYGGAQVADDAFLQSALAVAPRLKYFLKEDLSNLKAPATASGTESKSHFHRFVTVSDDCKVDIVANVAQKTLAPENERNIHGKTARKLGGIRGNSVVHLTDPHYLLTPDQYDFSATMEEEQYAHDNDSIPAEEHQTNQDINTPEEPSGAATDKPSTTRSTLAAHSTGNYLKGISRESKDHPLSTDLPEEVRDWMGELPWTLA